MASSTPTECMALSKSSFAGNCAAYDLNNSKLLASTTDVKHVGTVINGLLNSGSTVPQTSAALIAGGLIVTGATNADVSKSIERGLAQAADPNWEGWSCCRDSQTGIWYPYHSEKGWDRNIPC